MKTAVITNWCVYILKCRGSRLYTGITRNLDHRLKMHEAGKGSRFVHAFRPFTLLCVILCEDGHAARTLECKIKKMSRAQKLALAKISGSR
jgi:putative endonuclease